MKHQDHHSMQLVNWSRGHLQDLRYRGRVGRPGEEGAMKMVASRTFLPWHGGWLRNSPWTRRKSRFSST